MWSGSVAGCMSFILFFLFSSFFSFSVISSYLSVFECLAALSVCLSPFLRCLNTSKFFTGLVVLAGAWWSGEWMHAQWWLSQKVCIDATLGTIVWHTSLSWPRWMANAQMLNALAWSLANTLKCATPWWLVSRKVSTSLARVIRLRGLFDFLANMVLHRKGAIMKVGVVFFLVAQCRCCCLSVRVLCVPSGALSCGLWASYIRLRNLYSCTPPCQWGCGLCNDFVCSGFIVHWCCDHCHGASPRIGHCVRCHVGCPSAGSSCLHLT